MNETVRYAGGGGESEPYAFLPTDSDNGNISVVDVISLDDNDTDVINKSACSNDYCVSDEEYLDMIVNYIYPNTFEWILIAMYAMVLVVGLIGNFLVVFVVCRNKSMQTVTNYFIVNLSLADFLVILICLPPTVLEDVTETWYIDSAMCKIIKYFQGVSVSVSVLTLSVISIERYYAICHPLAFRSTTKRARVLILIIWLLALALYAPELYALGLVHRMDPDITYLLTTCKPVGWASNAQAVYSLCLIVALYILPFCLMGFAYSHIAMCLWSNAIPSETSSYSNRPHHHGAKHHHAPHQENFQQQMLARRKVAKMLIAVVVMFGICYLPVHMLNIIRYANALSDKISNYLPLIAHWTCYFNSAINPVIYSFMSAKFRKEFANVCSCCRLPFQKRRGHIPVQGHRAHGQMNYRGDSTYAYRGSPTTMSETEQITLKTLTSSGPKTQYHT